MPCYGEIFCSFCFAPVDYGLTSKRFPDFISEEKQYLFEWLNDAVILTHEDDIVLPTYNPGLVTGMYVNDKFYHIDDNCFIHKKCLFLVFKYLGLWNSLLGDYSSSIFDHNLQEYPPSYWKSNTFIYQLMRNPVPLSEDTFYPVSRTLPNAHWTGESCEGFHEQQSTQDVLEHLIKEGKIWMYHDPKFSQEQQGRFLRLLKSGFQNFKFG